MVIFCVLVVVKVRYGSKFIYFLSILFLQLKKFIQCFNYFYFLQGYCYVTFVHGNQGIFGILQFFWLFCTVLCHFIFFIAVILLFMHFTELCSCITLFILLYQCVYYFQCRQLLVSKHCSFVECSIDFLVVISYFSISVLLFVLLLKYLVSLISVLLCKCYNCSKVVCSLKYSSNTAYSVFIKFCVVILGFGVFCKCMVCLNTLIFYFCDFITFLLCFLVPLQLLFVMLVLHYYVVWYCYLKLLFFIVNTSVLLCLVSPQQYY